MSNQGCLEKMLIVQLQISQIIVGIAHSKSLRTRLQIVCILLRSKEGAVGLK